MATIRSRGRLVALVTCIVALTAMVILLVYSQSPTAVLASSSQTAQEVKSGFRGPLEWLHYDVILASRNSYPQALMIGFCAYGNLILRRECNDKRYPTWFFGWILGFICYGYPGAVFSDILFAPNAALRAMSNDYIFFWFSFWFLAIQYCDPVYRFLQRKHIFIFLTTWWLADATRASLTFLERAVTVVPCFSRGIWQAFIWSGAGPVARVLEKSIRGEPLPTLDKVQPNTLNILKFPIICMFWNMIFYMIYLAYLTDCNVFGKEPRITMVECGNRHEDAYAFCTYWPCVLHIGRAYYALYMQGGLVIFADGFCMGSSRDLKK